MAQRDSDVAAIRSVPTGQRAGSKYDRLIAKAKGTTAAKTTVLHPCDETSLRGPIEAAEAGIIVPILVGPKAKITAVAREHMIDIGKYEIVDDPTATLRRPRRSS